MARPLPDHVWFAMSPAARERWVNPPQPVEYVPTGDVPGKPDGRSFRSVMLSRFKI